ncbi:unnamed protein product [Acanthoscelides obtectus]|uniref:Uncharacterized protein n=1 Tax=Acanthoscelides obtectus TaxID=200917 RepID=A0A9P0P4X4_ACAOB|nr:unnamed protein product [Acanthoscelides obtectus]CAK1667361.1 hypothetical protein AOBTE_LOCUS25800 [Acanthoscelides obtectus]
MRGQRKMRPGGEYLIPINNYDVSKRFQETKNIYKKKWTHGLQ